MGVRVGVSGAECATGSARGRVEGADWGSRGECVTHLRGARHCSLLSCGSLHPAMHPSDWLTDQLQWSHVKNT